jgi:hypothetical protein
LGILNCYRECILLAAQHLAPLNELLPEARKKESRNVPWTTAAELLFENCETSLTQEALLSHPCPKAPLALVTDESYVVTDVSLEQKCDGNWKPFGFFSWKLTSTENRHFTYDWKLLAVYAAIKFF